MIGVIDGRKKTVRKIVVPLSPWFSSIAASSEQTIPSGTTISAYVERSGPATPRTGCPA